MDLAARWPSDSSSRGQGAARISLSPAVSEYTDGADDYSRGFNINWTGADSANPYSAGRTGASKGTVDETASSDVVLRAPDGMHGDDQSSDGAAGSGSRVCEYRRPTLSASNRSGGDVLCGHTEQREREDSDAKPTTLTALKQAFGVAIVASLNTANTVLNYHNNPGTASQAATTNTSVTRSEGTTELANGGDHGRQVMATTPTAPPQFDWHSLIPLFETAGSVAAMVAPGGAAFLPLFEPASLRSIRSSQRLEAEPR